MFFKWRIMFFKCLEFAGLFPCEVEFRLLFLKFMKEKNIENKKVKYIGDYCSLL